MFMVFRTALLTFILAMYPLVGWGAETGTPDEQDACRPDVRRFCYKLSPNADPNDFLMCLENNRDRLSKKCLAVLMDHGR